MNWLLPISVTLISIGIVVAVLEEWKRYGLTDTSFTSLLCWMGGLVGLGYWAVIEQDEWLGLAVGVPLAVFGYWTVLKWRDRARRRRKHSC